MQAKLTLKLDQDVIAAAKDYAAARKESLSGLVENFFKSLSLRRKHKKPDLDLSPIVAEMYGMIKTKKNINEKKILEEYYVEKYLSK